MKKVLYIIPGWEESCGDRPYRLLAEIARQKDYEVIEKNIDWRKPLSSQLFPVPSEAVLFGFSLGAIVAWLVAQKYPCQHLILASMTPHYNFTDPGIKKALIDLVGQEFVDDIISHLSPIHQAKRQTILYGDQEGEKADVLVLHSEHELNSNYIQEITKLF